MKEYRIQEYIRDMGVFKKHAIHHVLEQIYANTNFGISPNLNRRMVLLPTDGFADDLPDTVRTHIEMAAIVDKHHRINRDSYA